jgi:alanine dehydrogenase
MAGPLIRRVASDRMAKLPPRFSRRRGGNGGGEDGGWCGWIGNRGLRMVVGVPKEIKADEYRVAMLPVGVEELSTAGHRVLVERGAGLGSGILDSEYESAGATIVPEADAIWAEAELVVKVKEPQPSEWPRLRAEQTIFTYFHFAADEELTRAMIACGVTAIAYETLRDPRGGLPLLTPMSEVAGRMSIQEGAKFLERPQEGRGILLAGVPGVAPAEVAILGGGVVGSNAAKVAAGLGATVRILDINLDRLRYLDDIMPPNVTTLYSDRHTVREAIERADLVVGAVLITGARAPRLVRREDLGRMKNGSVIVDVAIDQGGCVETSRPTTHRQPTFVIDGVVHYCVTNMPGAVGRTSTYALCNVTLPYVLQFAEHGWQAVAAADPGVAEGVNIDRGRVTNRAVAATFGLEYSPLLDQNPPSAASPRHALT